MRAMYRRKTEKEIRCPLEYGLELFGGKWKSRIICVLAQKKTLRYGELRAELANITDAVLSRGAQGATRRRHGAAPLIRRDTAARRIFADGQGTLRSPYSPEHLPLVGGVSRRRRRRGVPRLSGKFRTERKSVKSMFYAARLSRELTRQDVLPRAAVCLRFP